MNMLIIFGAKYLLFVSAVVAIFYLLKQSRERQKEIIIFSVIIFPLSYGVAKILGHFYFDPRPFAAGHFTPLISHAADNGFPSDHTLLAAAIAAAIFRFNKKIGWLLFFLAILIGLARVLTGIHHIVDIAGSVAIVLIIYIFADCFILWLKKEKK